MCSGLKHYFASYDDPFRPLAIRNLSSLNDEQSLIFCHFDLLMRGAIIRGNAKKCDSITSNVS